MPTNLKFKIDNVDGINPRLIRLGFKFIESKEITDIYLEGDMGETRKLRIDSGKAKLISFSRTESGEIVSAPSIEFDNVEEALKEIESKEKIARTIKKRIEIYLKENSRAMFHFFHTEDKEVYFSLEEESAEAALEILMLIGLNIEERIEKSFDELIQ